MLSNLPTPKGVIQRIRKIQRTFLWSRKAQKPKWDLVSWYKLCKPKNLGGLGLQDPDIVNKACGAKLWWCWLKEPQTPWAKLWKAKYAEEWQSEELIRMKNPPTGYPIWNLARDNRNIIQDSYFWELHDGTNALFSKDA